MTQAVTYESRDGVALITINRPEKRNALNQAVFDGLVESWRRLASGPDRAAVLTGAGNDAFSVGADLKDFPGDLWPAVPGLGIALDKPVVAAVAGWCIGGGMVMVQMADLCVAADNTVFSYPEAKIGFSGGLITSLAVRLPHKIAMELILVGDQMTAQRAYEVGLVNQVVAVGEQVPAALAYARKLADNAPLVVQLLKRFVGRTLPMGPTEAAAVARRDVEMVNRSRDFGEGVAAFRGKRKPEFTGE